MSRTERFVLLRHAQAGERSPDPGTDVDRELDDTGREIAGRLHATLADFLSPAAIVTSPLRRCVQTVIPLAAAFDLPVQTDERWAPLQPFEDTYRAFAGTRPHTVVCTHGEVITLLLDGAECAKGAFWIIERRNDRLIPVLYVDAYLPPARGAPSGW